MGVTVKAKKAQNDSKKLNSRNFLVLGSVLIAILGAVLMIKCQNKSKDRLKYWSIKLKDFGTYASSLRTHDRVFSRLNYDFVNASKGDDWDILWALEQPFDDSSVHPLYCDVKNQKLEPHQKVNHFPGIYSLVSKSIMSDLNRDFEFILPSFILPQEKEDFDKFIAENPKKKLLQKNFYNRGVKIVKVKEIDQNLKEVFYQEFMDNPFLIDGHAFDFGVFVLITSFDPIRAYRFDEEILLRFCAKKYHPFDAEDRDKYVVMDGSAHVSEMPSFADDYKNLKLSSKIMFESLIKSQGFDVEKFWERIDKAIGTIVRNSEDEVRSSMKRLNFSSHHFFELVRFDIILDAELNPFVVEVNMSPNLTPFSEKYEENSLIYEQLIYNVMKMIGGSSHHEFHSRFDSTDSIVSNYKNLATSTEICLKPECSNCSRTFCKICHPCMSSDVRYQLSEAFREHQNSANFKRVFPTENHFNDEKLISKMTKKNQIQMRWFKGKCEEDEKWC